MCSGALLAQPTQPFDTQGHRGARGLAPENTLPAFYKALDLGVRTLELDVVVSADSVVVVSHEPWFNPSICRIGDEQHPPKPGKRNNIYRSPYLGIAQCDCGSYPNPRFPEQVPEYAVKPTLRQVLDSADAYARKLGRALPYYNVEIKAKPSWDGRFTPSPALFVELVLRELQRDSSAVKRVSIQSFDVRILQRIRNVYGRTFPLVYLIGNAHSLEQNLKHLGFVPAVYSPIYLLVDSTLVQKVQAAGMKLIPWTVNEPKDIARMIRLGVDGIISDYPDRLMQAVKASAR
jgi:glycerophosphoryl diester phosphodiesterase